MGVRMKLPKASAPAARLFAELLPPDSRVQRRLMFGQQAAFVNGNMFFGVFGEELFVRLSDRDRESALRIEGSKVFEPIAGHRMSEYVVLPPTVLRPGPGPNPWVRKAQEYAAHLPPKVPKARPKPKRIRSPVGRTP